MGFRLLFRTLSTAAAARCSLRQMAPSRQERRKAERDAAKRAPARAGAGGAGGVAAALANLNVNPLGDWTTQAEDPLVGPGGYCLARQVTGCRLTQETRVQSAVPYVASVPRVVPGGYCLARHVIGCGLTQETRIHNAVPDVASNVCQARFLGARSRSGEAEGWPGRQGSPVEPGCRLLEQAEGHAGFMDAGGRSPLLDVGLALSTYMYVLSGSPVQRAGASCDHLTK